MPLSQGHKYIVQARDLLTGWPEWKVLTCETGRTIGQFIFDEILCHWGRLEKIVMDNRTPFVAALDWIAERYHICYIRISAYNSQSNGVVETTHRTIRDGLIKMCAGNIKKWYEYAPHMFWADRVTTWKSTGMTLYYAVHRVEPLHSFDITEATFLAARINSHLSTASLYSICARMLQKCDKNIVLKRKRDRPRDIEEVRQQGVKDKGTKKSDKERSKIREGQKTLKMREKLTKKKKKATMPLTSREGSSS